MNLILDTHTFLWQLNDPKLISPQAMAALKNPENLLYVSIVSLWEISILISLKRIRAKHTLEEMFQKSHEDAGVELLHIKIPDLERLTLLPFHHRDPFDRLLIAQARSLGATLVSRDRAFHEYQISLLW